MWSSRSSVMMWAGAVALAGILGSAITGCASNNKEQVAQPQIIPLTQAPPEVAQFVRSSLSYASVTGVERLRYEYSPEVEYYRIHYTDRAGRRATIDYTPLQPEAHLAAYREPKEQVQ